MTKNRFTEGTTYLKAICQKCSGPTKQYSNLGMLIGIFQENSTVCFIAQIVVQGALHRFQVPQTTLHCHYSKVIIC